MVPAQGQGVYWDVLSFTATLRQYFFIKDTVLSFYDHIPELKWPSKSNLIEEDSILTIDALRNIGLTAYYLP